MVAAASQQIQELELGYLLRIVNIERRMSVLEKSVLALSCLLGITVEGLSPVDNEDNSTHETPELDLQARMLDLDKRMMVLENAFNPIHERLIEILHQVQEFQRSSQKGHC